MQYEADSPEAYLQSLALDWRKEKLEELRTLILSQSNELEECINYKMLCYRLNDNVVFHLNAQKGYVSLYVGDIRKIDPQQDLLEDLNVGKGCIRFTKSKDISLTRIDEFIAKAIESSRKDVDLDC
ncbi:MAG: DUF1801 domain-containing protein [Cyanobacteria bacterium P01_G01_bin.54]